VTLSYKAQAETRIICIKSLFLISLVKTFPLSNKRNKLASPSKMISLFSMVQISIKNYLVTRGSITPSLLGRTSYQFNSSNFYVRFYYLTFNFIANGFLFNSFSIRGNQSSAITLSFQGIFNNTYINQVLLLVFQNILTRRNSLRN